MDNRWLAILFFCLCTLLSFTNAALGQVVKYAITHVTVIDPTDGRSQQDMAIVVSGNDIESVVPSSQLHLPTSTEVISCKGMFVIPGLWDMHVHFRDVDRDLNMDVANGVLGIRNMGGIAKEVFAIRQQVAAGQRLGPKIVASGPIVDGPNSWSNPAFTISVKSPEEARSTIRSLKQQGADFIKVYDGLPHDTYHAIADETKKLGLPFAGHVPTSVSVQRPPPLVNARWNMALAFSVGARPP
ncbi:MAG TPA: hypothetical protein VJQ54_13625, partial [Candidatus Sulfotelmatobacter sp.]|nr:hypothetical protein [Candidatus Sulfotelmatobacter sp.]